MIQHAIHLQKRSLDSCVKILLQTKCTESMQKTIYTKNMPTGLMQTKMKTPFLHSVLFFIFNWILHLSFSHQKKPHFEAAIISGLTCEIVHKVLAIRQPYASTHSVPLSGPDRLMAFARQPTPYKSYTQSQPIQTLTVNSCVKETSSSSAPVWPLELNLDMNSSTSVSDLFLHCIKGYHAQLTDHLMTPNPGRPIN